ncbi:MAG: hypothetical protein QF726_06975, partial [Alphaproteobacteria bacterium]|nr:hypothetical protein [Alphaproteobacteria bacterium]
RKIRPQQPQPPPDQPPRYLPQPRAVKLPELGNVMPHGAKLEHRPPCRRGKSGIPIGERRIEGLLPDALKDARLRLSPFDKAIDEIA